MVDKILNGKIVIYPFPFASERQKWEFMQRDFCGPSLICFMCKMLRFLDFHRVPIGTIIFMDGTNHVLVQKTHNQLKDALLYFWGQKTRCTVTGNHWVDFQCLGFQ